jgi:cytochrome c
VGRAKALADFNAGKAPFKDRDLYVVCLAPNNTIAANGQFPKYVGSPVDVLKDAKGKPLGTEILKAGSAKEGGTVSFVMTNPVSGKMEPKVLFAQKFSDDVCGVGAYTAP